MMLGAGMLRGCGSLCVPAVCMHACMYVYMYVFMYLCMYELLGGP
jgi:hypothetical protein